MTKFEAQRILEQALESYKEKLEEDIVVTHQMHLQGIFTEEESIVIMNRMAHELEIITDWIGQVKNFKNWNG